MKRIPGESWRTIDYDEYALQFLDEERPECRETRNRLCGGKRFMKARNFDDKFERNEEDLTEDLDLSRARRPGREEHKRLNVDFPVWLVDRLDRQTGSTESLSRWLQTSVTMSPPYLKILVILLEFLEAAVEVVDQGLRVFGVARCNEEQVLLPQ